MIPAPLYKDPIYNGAADPMVIRKESDGRFYMFYTQRRANQQVEGVSYCYGCSVGVAESPDGRDWHRCRHESGSTEKMNRLLGFNPRYAAEKEKGA